MSPCKKQARRCGSVSENPKDQSPDEQPRRSILVTLLIAAAIALLAGFLAWGVPVMLKAGAREDAQDTFAILDAEPQDPGQQAPAPASLAE
jgi:hypothetical protein